MDLEHERRLTDVEALAKRNEGRIKKIEGEHEVLHQLATSVAVMAEKQGTMNENVEKLTEKVEHIESKPAKKWESIEEKILLAVVAAVVGYILAQIGLG
jgi:type II secretory pathway component PulF